MPGDGREGGLVLAALAGLWGTCGSAFAKLAFSRWMNSQLCDTDTYDIVKKSPHNCENVAFIFRGVALLLAIIANGAMWQLFAKALVKCNTSVEAIIGSTISGSCASAIIGWFMFSERFSLTWYVGLMFIVAGLVVINASGETLPVEAAERKEQ